MAAEEQPGDLADVRARCGYGSADVASFTSASGLLAFGPHWNSLRAVQLGQNEQLARLEAGPDVAAELDRLPLHPALLDEATAYIAVSGEHSYLPLGYGRVPVRAPLPARLWSHARHRDTGGGEVLAADLTLYDDAGEAVVTITDFVLRRIDKQAVTKTVGEGARQGAEEAAVNEESATAGVALDLDGARRGIAPADGAEAFRRLLAARLGPQVVVNATALPEFVAGVRELTQDTVADELDAASAAGGQDALPSDHVAPRNDLESTLAGLWGEVIGARQVSVEQDFFELGGNSLVAVQLIALDQEEDRRPAADAQPLPGADRRRHGGPRGRAARPGRAPAGNDDHQAPPHGKALTCETASTRSWSTTRSSTPSGSPTGPLPQGWREAGFDGPEAELPRPHRADLD